MHDGILGSKLVARGFIHSSDLCLFKGVHSAEEAANEIATFFLNYHSLRMAGSSMLLCLHYSLSPRQLLQLNEEFSDIVDYWPI